MGAVAVVATRESAVAVLGAGLNAQTGSKLLVVVVALVVVAARLLLPACLLVDVCEGRAPGVGCGPRVVVWLWRCPTLPHPPRCSTIGAVGLSFQVRKVDWAFPLRYDHHKTVVQPFCPPWRVLASGGPYTLLGGCGLVVIRIVVDEQSVDSCVSHTRTPRGGGCVFV